MAKGMFGSISGLFSGVTESASKLTRTPEVQKWLDEISKAKEREAKYRKEARNCVDVYEQKAEAEGSAYNILYANTDTLSPALYNSTPRPVVKVRFQDAKLPARAAARVLKRGLEFLIDSNQPAYTPFDDLMKKGVQEALVPGRGVTRFKYDATITQIPPTEEELALNPKAEPQERLDYETVCGEKVGWDRICLGYAEEWNNVPWVAFEHFMTREECIKNFGEELGSEMQLTAVPQDAGDKEDKGPKDAKGAEFAHVWEIWDKSSKKVIFVSDGHAKPVKTVDDPLRLEGFYPLPEPLVLLHKIGSMVPTPLYAMYEAQAKELNTISKRIIKITSALKVRGFYDSTLEGLDQLLEKGDNTLIAARNVSAMQQGQTLEKAIWLMPIEQLVAVLQQLYLNRQQCKSVIYEITGIADIMRGSSAASETLGAQKMKESWGTMRLKRMQKEVQRYSRESLRIMAELAANNFSAETWQAITGIELPTGEQKAQAQALLQQSQAMAQQTGQPPSPPNPEQLKLLATPSWDEVIQILQNDLLRNFAIDIETNSTIDAEATEDKKEVAEFMNAMSQLLNGLQPMITDGIMPFDVAKGLMVAVVQRFRFGDEVMEGLQNMQPPRPKPDPAQEKAKAEMERDKQKFALEQQKAEAENQRKQQLAAQEMQIEEQTLALKQQEGRLKERELQMKREFMEAKHQLDMQMLIAKATMPPPQAAQSAEA